MDAYDTLVERFRAGDAEAFSLIVRGLQDEIRCTVAARADSAEMVDEIVQRSFVSAFTRIGQYRGPGVFPAWVKSIARNHLRLEWRERARLAQASHDELGELLAASEEARVDAAEADHESVRLGRLAECLAKLEPSSRRLLEMRYAEGTRLDDLARRVQSKPGTLAMQLMRLRHALRRCILSQEAGTGP